MFVTFYLLNGLMAVIGVLHILRKIGPNHFVGIRIGKTLGNEALWYDAHVFAGWSMLITSIVSIAVLASLWFYRRYQSPEFPAELVGALTTTALLCLGDALVPLVHILRMPNDSDSSDMFRSNYAIMVYLIVSVVMIVMMLPAAFDRVGPNGTYGFRTAKTLSSEAMWYASNHFAGWASIIAGCLTIGGLILLRFGRIGKLSENGYIYLLTFLVPSVMSIVVSVVYVYCVL